MDWTALSIGTCGGWWSGVAWWSATSPPAGFVFGPAGPIGPSLVAIAVR